MLDSTKRSRTNYRAGCALVLAATTTAGKTGAIPSRGDYTVVNTGTTWAFVAVAPLASTETDVVDAASPVGKGIPLGPGDSVVMQFLAGDALFGDMVSGTASIYVYAAAEDAS
jgi:hypothetical protein